MELQLKSLESSAVIWSWQLLASIHKVCHVMKKTVAPVQVLFGALSLRHVVVVGLVPTCSKSTLGAAFNIRPAGRVFGCLHTVCFSYFSHFRTLQNMHYLRPVPPEVLAWSGFWHVAQGSSCMPSSSWKRLVFILICTALCYFNGSVCKSKSGMSYLPPCSSLPFSY